MAVSLFMVSVPQAQAMVTTGGACAVTVSIQFTGATLKATPATLPYSFTISGATGITGLKPCVVKGSSLTDVQRSTGGDGTGSGLWSCGLVLNAQGLNAQQTWTDSGGNLDPAPFAGNHTISGVWGAWAMTLTAGLAFTGEIALTHDGRYATELANCGLPSGTSTVHMIGLEIFEDPVVPAP